MKASATMTGSTGMSHIPRKMMSRTALDGVMSTSSRNSAAAPSDRWLRMFRHGAAYQGGSGMADVLSIGAAAISGGAVMQGFQMITGWMKQRHESKHADRSVDAQLEEHRDNLTLKLLDTAQRSVVELQKQVGDLLPNMTAAAHLQESLDHLHALLHADGKEEISAARRRANAFLRRMRPEIGDLRNAAQVEESARHVRDRLEGNEA